jgi:hypothetical protein
MIWRIIATGGALSFLFTGFTVLGDPSCVTADIGGGGRVVGVTCRGDSYGTWTGSAAGLIMCLIGIGLLVLIYWRYLRNFLPSSLNSTTQSSQRYASGSDLRGKFCNYCKREIPTESQECPNCFPEQVYVGSTGTKKCVYCKKNYDINLKNCPSCFPEIVKSNLASGKIKKDEPKKAINQLQKTKDSNLTVDMTQIKVCDGCKSEVHIFYPKCFNCEGTSFTHMQVKKPVVKIDPEFKTCPMCAEDIKFAAKKCRYCQHMLTE